MLNDTKDWEDLLLDHDLLDEESDGTPVDLENIEKNISQYSSQKLCEMIVSARYLSMDNQISVLCMQELATRRTGGDSFDFESQITLLQKELPVLDFSVTDIRSVLTQVVGKKL